MTETQPKIQKHKRVSDPQRHAATMEPGDLQREASQPERSVWVSASAGSGKTKVLIDRVLRLLLPRANGQPGTPPHKILCITFTKAGASEMQLRIARKLGAWAVMEPDLLHRELAELLDYPPRPDDVLAAQKLFAELTETPHGVQIVTIHAFCQSVLGRFPLEAGLTPFFSPLEERQSQALLERAAQLVLHQAAQQNDGPLPEALMHLGIELNDEQFYDVIKKIQQESYQLRSILQKHFSPEGAYTALCAAIGITPGHLPEDVIAQACRLEATTKNALKSAAANLLTEKAKGRASLANGILYWLSLSAAARAEQFDNYCYSFLNQKNLPHGQIFTDKFERESEHVFSVLINEANRLAAVQERINASRCALLTRCLLTLGEKILNEYEVMKQSAHALDFDDMISKTLSLLSQKDMASWVQYKLDEGLDHLLLDEAQDTNPEQWEIIRALADEFMTGQGARDIQRTVFVVGDEKQSIYGFQRAAPEEFKRMHAYFEKRVRDAKQDWANVPLNISFRSTESVLKAVDAVFPHTRHYAYREKQPGRVELWPISVTIKMPESNPWEPPVSVIENASGSALLAQKIADQIKSWIGFEFLPSQNRFIEPQDILILVRTRNAFFHQITKALRQNNIAVSGIDRLIINQNIAVQDILALAEFCLLNSDDLSLACVLKSPLIGWNDDDLYNASAQRAGTLIDSVKIKAPTIYAYLKNIIDLSRTHRPFEFFSHILHMPCPANTVSGSKAFTARLGADATDSLDELLNAALSFEKLEIPTLQGFLHWQSQDTSGIKREAEQPRGEVRIMTVHGAKGLQAPIVILPDTTALPLAGRENLLWPDKTGLPAPLYCPRTENSFEAFKTAQSRITDRLYEEYNRLLYVAMTRAEDRLYIAGYQGEKPINEDCWYSLIQKSFETMDEVQTLDDGTLRLENREAKPKKYKAEQKSSSSLKADLPPWLFSPAPPEPVILKPLRPSQDHTSEPAAASPVSHQDPHRFVRGILTHRLLQFLPGIPAGHRNAAALKFIENFGASLSPELKTSIAEETLNVMQAFPGYFDSQAFAEIPVTGMTGEGRIISGQIDRLLITPTDIWIIDYKTNRPPPRNADAVPAIYKQQMQSYADILKDIYPKRTIHAALLWTDGPFLMELDLKAI